MTDRTDRPRDRLPRPAVIDPGKDWQEVELIRDVRLAPQARCGNCHHCYVYRVAPGQINPSLVCHEAPPITQLIANQAGMSVQIAPRVVSEQFFCHHWRTRD